MKKILLPIFAVALFTACNCSSDEKTGAVTNARYSSNLDNVDSLVTLVPQVWRNLPTIIETSAHSGKFASKITAEQQFSVAYENELSNIGSKIPKELKFTAFASVLVPDSKILVVVSASGQKYYKAVNFSDEFTALNSWKQISATFTLPNSLSKSDVIKAYVWNNKAGEVLIDDIDIEFTF